MGRPMNRQVTVISRIVPMIVGIYGACHAVAPAAAAAVPDLLGHLTAVCALNSGDTAGMRRVFTDGRVLKARVDGPAGTPFRSYHRILMPGGGEWVVSRLSPAAPHQPGMACPGPGRRARRHGRQCLGRLPGNRRPPPGL